MRKGLPEGASLFGADWKTYKKSNGIGYEYALQRPTPAYKTLHLEKEVEELIVPYEDGVKLRKRVAKVMSVSEVKLLLTGEVTELDERNLLEEGTGGGIMKQIPGGPAGWLAYVAVEDVHASTKKALSLGGQVMVDVTEVQGMVWFSFIRDPTGAILGLWQTKAM